MTISSCSRPPNSNMLALPICTSVKAAILELREKQEEDEGPKFLYPSLKIEVSETLLCSWFIMKAWCNHLCFLILWKMRSLLLDCAKIFLRNYYVFITLSIPNSSECALGDVALVYGQCPQSSSVTRNQFVRLSSGNSKSGLQFSSSNENRKIDT